MRLPKLLEDGVDLGSDGRTGHRLLGTFGVSSFKNLVVSHPVTVPAAWPFISTLGDQALTTPSASVAQHAVLVPLSPAHL